MHLNKRGDYIVTTGSAQRSIICQFCERRVSQFNGHGWTIELRRLAILGHCVYINLLSNDVQLPHEVAPTVALAEVI